MSKNIFVPILSSLVVLFLNLFAPNATASTVANNIALLSLGAQAYDNGHWVEQSYPNHGYQYSASLAFDNTSSTIWFGLGTSHPQQLWVTFDKQYIIDEIYVNEYGGANTDIDYAYATSGSLEYLSGGAWHLLTNFAKSTPDLTYVFSPIAADGVRFSVISSVQPSGWINKASGVWSLEVSAVPEPETYAMMLAGLGLLGFIRRRRKQSAA